MQRRDFIFKLAITCTGSLLAACSTGPTVTDHDISTRRRDIDAGFYATLERLYPMPGLRELINKACGVLVFPTVLTGGTNSGNLYGEGVLRIADAMAAYYRIRSWQVTAPTDIPAQEIALLYLFMEQDALDQFRNNDNWVAGRDAIVKILGENGGSDQQMATVPILALALGPHGLDSAITNRTLRNLVITPLEL